MFRDQIHETNILVIDDQQMNLDLVRDLLDVEGFRHVHTTKDPLQLSLLLNQLDIDLVLLDINMPILDGFACLALIKQHFTVDSVPPVIMLTAQNDQDNRVKALRGGASDYVMKPFNRYELLKRIEIQLENWLMKKMLRQQNKMLEKKGLGKNQSFGRCASRNHLSAWAGSRIP